MPVIGFAMLVETDDASIRFPKALITCGNLNDNVLQQYIASAVPENTNITADEIKTLLLVAVDVDTNDEYFEALNPYKYWPIRESEKHASLRAKFRE